MWIREINAEMNDGVLDNGRMDRKEKGREEGRKVGWVDGCMDAKKNGLINGRIE